MAGATDGAPLPPSAPPTAVRRIRWGPVCGLVATGYVAAVAVDRIALAVDGGTANDLRDRLDNPVGRLVLAVVVVAALFHALDGVRRLVVRPGAPTDPAARAAVAFATGALGVPLAVVVLWPWLDGVVP